MTNKNNASSFGIGEWYGKRLTKLSAQDKLSYASQKKKKPKRECPFLVSYPNFAPKAKNKTPKLLCNKKGGVCSIRRFSKIEEHESAIDFGPLTATCPNRLVQNGVAFNAIAKNVLGIADPLIVKEMPFLTRPEATEENVEDVGRIDIVLMDPDLGNRHWCAVEMQAVYFSGGSMDKDFAAIVTSGGASVNYPAAQRRPDFRSSGPKRLMPQLQVKVPALRRWGKKMAVVVDQQFFNSLAPMSEAKHVSNADIVWIVMDYEEPADSSAANLVFKSHHLTTLETSVEGLTAGVPTSLEEFEAKLIEKAKFSGSSCDIS